ncbi:hypothetical protein OLZ31_14565 [Enterobacter asburiae]|nr:hypothetical protein [Enterobacter asburiae]
MAYKQSVSTYFTNEKQFDIFKKRTKSEGKSVSKKLMELIERDLGACEQETSSPLLPGCVSFAPFVSYEQFSSAFSSAFYFAVDKKDKTEVKKKIFEEVDSHIKRAFVERIKFSYTPSAQKRFMIVKFSLDIAYQVSVNDTDDTIVEGNYSFYGALIEITENLWMKFGGLYDLEKIQYYKYLDLFKPQKKQKKIAILSERPHSPDSAGGFFIPVHSVGLKYPEKPDETKFEFFKTGEIMPDGKEGGFYLQLTGVNIYSNVHRVKLTQLRRMENGIAMNTSTRIKSLIPPVIEKSEK